MRFAIVGTRGIPARYGGFETFAEELSTRLAARGLASLGAVAVSTEIFAWMVRNPDHPVAKALAKPGHEIQHRLATAEPTHEQLELAEAALAACLELENGDAD